MSQLENAVKPFTAGMIVPGHLTFLSEERRRLLARWAVKVAMVHEFFKPDDRFYFGDSDRRELMTSPQTRNDIWVWLGKYDATRPMHSVQDRKIDNATQAVRFYCLTLNCELFGDAGGSDAGSCAKTAGSRVEDADGRALAYMAEQRRLGRTYAMAAANHDGSDRPENSGHTVSGRRGAALFR
jgi:hypothetical protein